MATEGGSCEEKGCGGQAGVAPCTHCGLDLCARHLQVHTQMVRSEIKIFINQIEAGVPKFDDLVEQLSEQCGETQKQAVRLKQTITDTLDDMVKRLQARKKQLSEEVDKYLRSAMKTYADIEETLRAKAGELVRFCRTLDDVMTSEVFPESEGKLNALITQCRGQMLIIRNDGEKMTLNKPDIMVDFTQIEAMDKVGKVSCNTRPLTLQLRSSSKHKTTNIATKFKAKEKKVESVQSAEVFYSKKGKPVKVTTKIQIGKTCRAWRPRGLTVCPHSDEIIVTEYERECVHVFTSLWKHVRTFGAKGSGPGEMNYVRGAAVNSRKEVVVCDINNKRLQVFTRQGEVVNVVRWERVMLGPWDVAVDAADNMYVVDDTAHCVLVFDSCGQPLHKLGQRGEEPGQYNAPCHIACHGDRLLVSEKNNKRVQLLTTEGRHLCYLGHDSPDGALQIPGGVAIDRQGRLLVVDKGDQQVKIYDPAGAYLCRVALQKFSGYAYSSCFLAVGREGQMHVTDNVSETILTY